MKRLGMIVISFRILKQGFSRENFILKCFCEKSLSINDIKKKLILLFDLPQFYTLYNITLMLYMYALFILTYLLAYNFTLYLLMITLSFN